VIQLQENITFVLRMCVPVVVLTALGLAVGSATTVVRASIIGDFGMGY
jgi:hypothetical protein